MKLLILGNHTCGNRGDISAILRGLLDAINILNPHAEVDVMSPLAGQFFLAAQPPGNGRSTVPANETTATAWRALSGALKSPPSPLPASGIALRVTDFGKLRNIAIAQGFTDFIAPAVSGPDAIIQVGGSFFVDLACHGLNMRFAHLWRKSRCL